METPIVKRLLLNILGDEFVSKKTHIELVGHLNRKDKHLKSRVRTLEFDKKKLEDNVLVISELFKENLIELTKRLERYKKYNITYKYS